MALFDVLFAGMRLSSAPPGARRFPFDPCCANDGMLIVLMFADEEDETPLPFINNFCRFPGCEVK